jgi:hypothetical protein
MSVSEEELTLMSVSEEELTLMSVSEEVKWSQR